VLPRKVIPKTEPRPRPLWDFSVAVGVWSWLQASFIYYAIHAPCALCKSIGDPAASGTVPESLFGASVDIVSSILVVVCSLLANSFIPLYTRCTRWPIIGDSSPFEKGVED
jgi:hypothetical protein